MLDKQIDYYKQNKSLFDKLYKGKYVVIKDKAVVGAYDTHKEAYDETIKDHEVGTFIIERPAKRK